MFTHTLGVCDLSCLFLNEPEIKYVINEHVCCNIILFYGEVKPGRSGLSLDGSLYTGNSFYVASINGK